MLRIVNGGPTLVVKLESKPDGPLHVDDLAMRPYIAALNTAIEAGRVTWAGFYYIRHENKDGQDIYNVHPY